MYPYPEDFDMLLDSVQKTWVRWVNQVQVIGFNSDKYDLNLIKRYFVEEIVARKENDYMFLTTDELKFLDTKNFLAPDLSYEA